MAKFEDILLPLAKAELDPRGVFGDAYVREQMKSNFGGLLRLLPDGRVYKFTGGIEGIDPIRSNGKILKPQNAFLKQGNQFVPILEGTDITQYGEPIDLP